MPRTTPPKKLSQRRGQVTARLEALFASIGEGVITTDEHGIITRANQMALDTLGYSKLDILGKRFPDVLIALYDNGKVMDIFERPITRAFMTGHAIRERSIYRHKDGSLIPVFISVSPVMLGDRPIGAIEVFRDLTSELEQEKLKSDFISIASHQLRTPLSAIHMYTRMLHEGMGGELNPRQQKFTETVLSSVERMNGLIDTLLSITRIETGNLIIKPQPLEVTPLIDQLITEFLPEAKSKHSNLKADVQAEIPELHSDPILIKEVLSNFIANAIKYTPEHGTIQVSAMQKQDEIVFRVKDNGFGIPTENQRHIFTKFFRGENIIAKDVSGTGLGLYLTKIIADKLGGEVWFKSKENEGTEFYFSLKL